MTVREMEAYFADRELFPNPDQQVQLELDNGVRIELGGTVVPEKGVAVVRLRKAQPRKFMFSFKFEANPVIEAYTVEEAEEEAYELMRHRAVIDTCTWIGDEGYVAQEPYFLEEVKE